ncbi:hypothetical protein vseg_000545 [Gypsophila vaccaria]
MVIGDVPKMVTVGLIWGATNALMKKGAIIYDNKPTDSSTSAKNGTVYMLLKNMMSLIMTWQYSLPLLLNLSASAAFFALIGHTPISLAVPVTNATTFCATAVFGFLLGEDIRIGFALFGTFVTVLGVCLCVL